MKSRSVLWFLKNHCLVGIWKFWLPCSLNLSLLHQYLPSENTYCILILIRLTSLLGQLNYLLLTLCIGSSGKKESNFWNRMVFNRTLDLSTKGGRHWRYSQLEIYPLYAGPVSSGKYKDMMNMMQLHTPNIPQLS